MKTLGEWLRRAREAHGLTFKEVEAAIRIRPRFLEALESGDYAAFPGGEVQIRGFLRLYSRYLGLSPDEALARYDVEVHGVSRATTAPVPPPPTAPTPATTPPPTAPSPVVVPPPPARTFNPELLIVGGLVLIVILAIVTATGYFLSRRAGSRAQATTGSTTPVTTTAAPTPTPGPPPPSPTPTFPATTDGRVTVTLEATEHVWVRVRQDGQTVLETMLPPGQVETWTGQTIVVETGNGAGLQVTVNGRPQGPLGSRGTVCARTWTPAGEVTPPEQ